MLLTTLVALFLSLSISSADVIQSIDRVELKREEKLAGYTVTEKYRVTNSHFQTPAEMTVHTVYKRGEGKTYNVESRSGPEFLQTRILDRILASERDMSRGNARLKALLTSANYDVELIGEEKMAGRDCEVVSLKPKAKSTYLIKGKAWLDAKSFILVRLEGKPTASPSFFAGSPLITREYEEIDGFAVAKQSRARTESFLLGKTEVLIEYSDYQLQQ